MYHVRFEWGDGEGVMVAKYLGQNYSGHLFSLRPVGGTVTIQASELHAVTRLEDGATPEGPH